MFVARKVGSLVGLGKNYNKLVPSWFDHHREFLVTPFVTLRVTESHRKFVGSVRRKVLLTGNIPEVPISWQEATEIAGKAFLKRKKKS